MPVFSRSSRIRISPRTRAVGGLAASLTIVTLVGPAHALAAAPVAPVELGTAKVYSVLANSSVTSTGATAMSESLGISPAAALVGTPIVLGDTHLGDAEAAAAQGDLSSAYGDAVLRAGTPLATGDFAGTTYTSGVYGTAGAMGFTASGTMTLDAQDNPDAVFVFQVGGALSIGASAQIRLVNGAQACNVFWAVGGAATIGATAQFTGALMTDVGITVGANTRVDGRLLAIEGAITLSANPIRTDACASPPVVIVGPAGPAGADGQDGADGADGLRGLTGADGADGLRGLTGADGVDGTAGPAGLTGATGLAGAAGPTGAAGPAGLSGAAGLVGAAGATGDTGRAGLQGAVGANGAAGAQGPAGANGLFGLTGAAGPTGANGPAGPAAAVPLMGRTKLCVTDQADRATAVPGRLVTWTIVVRNCGPRPALDVSVTDRLRRVAARSGHGRSTLLPGHLQWTLAPGSATSYKVVTRISKHAPAGKYVSSATARASNAAAAIGQGATVVRSSTRAAAK